MQNFIECSTNKKEQTMKYKNITIIKRKNSNSWQARYRKNGKQYSISDKTQKGCYIKLKEALNDNTKLLYNNIKLKDWCQEWLKVYKTPNVRESTLNGIKLLIKNYFKGYLFEETITKIKPIEVESFINSIPYERVKQNVYIYLKEIFNKAISNNIINTNPLEETKKPKHIKQQKRALTISEQKQFEDYCIQDKEKYIYLICLWQGLRLGELRALEINDFNFENNTLTINKSINDVGNENKTKNEYSNRIMPLFTKTKNLIKQIECKEKERIFKHSKDYISRKLKEILDTLQIKDITMHSLRHTFITRMQENNVQLYILQNWVGHAQGSEITTKVYTHKQDEIEKNIIDIINNKN